MQIFANLLDLSFIKNKTRTTDEVVKYLLRNVTVAQFATQTEDPS